LQKEVAIVAVARSLAYRPPAAVHHWALAGQCLLALSGALLSLIGLILACGGLLSTFDGSAFDILAGLGLTVGGLFIARRSCAGARRTLLDRYRANELQLGPCH
jgi:hypothetical protein